jgi:hypothetical protein
MNDRIVLEVVLRYIGEEGHQRPALPGSRPNTVTVSRERAKALIEAGVCRFPPKPKEEPSAEKKSSGAPTAGHLIDTPSSSAPGRGIVASFLAVAHRLPGRLLRALSARGTSKGG